MNDRIVMTEGVTYHPRKHISYSTLYQFIQYCQENGLRFSQALWNILHQSNPQFWDTPEAAFFYIEDDQLEQQIKAAISAAPKEKSADASPEGPRPGERRIAI